MASYFDEDVPDVVLKSLFKKYDKDNSGSLTQMEIRILLEHDLGTVSSETDTHTVFTHGQGCKPKSFL